MRVSIDLDISSAWGRYSDVIHKVGPYDGSLCGRTGVLLRLDAEPWTSISKMKICDKCRTIKRDQLVNNLDADIVWRSTYEGRKAHATWQSGALLCNSKLSMTYMLYRIGNQCFNCVRKLKNLSNEELDNVVRRSQFATN